MDDAKAMASRPPHSEEDAKLQAKLFDLQQENKQQETQRGAFDRVSPATPLVPPTPGAGRWRSMLFGCGSDLPICCAVCCCHWVTTGQLYERAVRKRMLTRLPLLSCASIAMFIFGMDFYHQTMRSLFSSGTYLWINQAGAEGQLVNIFDPRAWVNATLDPKVDDEPGIEHSAAVMLLYIGELCAALASLCACAIVCTVRAALRSARTSRRSAAAPPRIACARAAATRARNACCYGTRRSRWRPQRPTRSASTRRFRSDVAQPPPVGDVESTGGSGL